MSKKARTTSEPIPPPGIDHNGQQAPKEPALTSPTEPPPDAKPPADPPAPEPTPEEIAAKAKAVIGKMFSGPSDKAEQPPAVEPEPEPKPPVVEEKPKETPPARETTEKPPEEPVKPASVVVPPPIAEAVKPEQLTPPPPPPPRPQLTPTEPDGLSAKERVHLDALARLERDGKAPKGIVDQTKRFWKDEAELMAKWEKENPGERFNPDAPEHSEWYDKNEPVVDEDDLETAIDANKEEAITAKVEAKLTKKQEEERYQRELTDVERKTEKVVGDILAEMVAEAGFDEFVTKGGKRVLNKDVENEIDKANPAAKPVLMEEAEVLAIQIHEIERMASLGDKYPMDLTLSRRTSTGQHINPHAMIREFTIELESEIAAQPPEATVRDGKRFVTYSDLVLAQQKIVESPATDAQKAAALAQLDAKYYTLGWSDLKRALLAKHSGRAKARIEAFGGKPGRAAAAVPPKTDKQKENAPPAEPSAPNRPPSVSTPSDVVDTRRPGTAPTRLTEESVVAKAFPS